MDRFVDQTTFYEPGKIGGGNCAEAACATLFGIPLSDVPRFYNEDDPEPSYRYWRNFENFCFSQGYWVVRRNAEVIMEATYLASGSSARGCKHMVVMRDGKLFHDPHPSRAGLEQVECTWLLVPLDPTNFKKVTE